MFWYIAYETVPRGGRTIIHSFGTTSQSALTKARMRRGAGKKLRTALAARALCDAFETKGCRVRIIVAANGRANLAPPRRVGRPDQPTVPFNHQMSLDAV